MGAAMVSTLTRVLVVDDEAIVRDSMVRLLTPAKRTLVVGVLPNANDLVQTVVRVRPDIVLLDLDMPGRNALEAVEDLRYRGDPTHVVILSAFMKEWQVRGALAYGARAYVHKDDAPDALFEAFEAVMQGQRYLSPIVARAHPDLS